jgi:hypothetical protein
MADVFLIPLSDIPQRFNIELGGRALIITTKFNTELNAWVLDLADANTDKMLIACLPMVTGADLLSAHGYLGISGALVVVTDGDDLAIPTQENLGLSANLYYVIAQNE